LLADTLTTGFGVINNDAAVRIGESVVIIGVGGIGLGSVLGAHLAGANPIVAVDIHDHKLSKAKEFGATHTINSRTGDFLKAAIEILDGRADVVIDCTGMPEILEKAFAITGAKGRCIGVGVMHFERKLTINTLALHFGKILTGSQGGNSRPAEDIPRYLRMMLDRRFDPHGFISHRFSLERINDGIERMRSGEVIHALVDFPSS
jgi:S-(hydroxymethyl)glutathione dehydrogenase/alcohol dehydrogenase